MSHAARLLFTFEGVAVVFVVLAVPLWKRRVLPNLVYGFRTPSTLSDPELWALVNEKTGRDMLVLGCSLGALAVVLFIADVSANVFAGLCVAWLLAGVAASAVHGFVLIGRSKKRSKILSAHT